MAAVIREDEDDEPRRRNGWLEHLPLEKGGWPLALLCTLAIFGLALLCRLLIDDALPPGFPFLTFFPAVILTAFVFGVRYGALSALLCGLAAWYFFMPPFYQFKFSGTGVALGLYIFVVGTDLALIHGLQVINRQLRDARRNSLALVQAKAQAVDELQARADELRRTLAALRESEMKSHLATQTAGVGIWQWHVPSDTLHWDETMFALYGVTPTPGGWMCRADYLERVHPDDVPDPQLLDTAAITEDMTLMREFRIRRGDDGRVRHLRAVEVSRTGPDGRLEWLVGTNLDITEQKNRERHVQVLLGEVNHRAKNLLAVVLAVARQTSGADHDTFLKNFAARIHSLAAGQDLLVQSEWKGVGLLALIRAQLGHFADLIGDRIILAGEDLPLSSSAVQTLGMTIHELVTNASKYGGLSRDHGCVTLTWQCLADAHEDRFLMTWTESGGPPVVPPQRSGFGSTVTGDMVRMSLDAVVESQFDPAGYRWALECALDVIVEREGA